MANSHLEPVLLSAYLDDEVSMDERTQVERHLVTCETCQVELDGLRWTANLLHQLPDMPLPQTFYLTEAMLEEPVSPIKKGWLQWIQSLFDGLGAVPIGVGATVMALVLLMVIVQPFSSVSNPQVAMAPLSTSNVPEESISALSMQPEEEAAMSNQSVVQEVENENNVDSASSGIAVMSEKGGDEMISKESLSTSAVSVEQEESEYGALAEEQSDDMLDTTMPSLDEASETEMQDPELPVSAEAARAASAEDVEQDSAAALSTPASTPRINRAIAATATTDLIENSVVTPSASPIALAPQETSPEPDISSSNDESIFPESSQFRLMTLILIGIVLFFISCMIYWRRRAN